MHLRSGLSTADPGRMDLSPGSLVASFVVSTVGYACFRYGKKQVRLPQVVVGIVLMLAPLVVSNPLALWSTGGVLCAGLWGATRAGY